ncbi:TIR protein [Methanobacterium lacus]|uniref:TIR protein n=1 Tax=Methanobacterium lacus (strain AL-21) TaxID=877455 RepID=F0T5W2_METLA|nr:toll/interleukin-1 receptor domain-containing protein [Methanobacterium lacus]ADZ09355.1 TIR protein [Methanobacterium lacus]
MNKHVFISYSHEDKYFANRIAEDLMKNGIEVWFDKWEIQVGDSLIEKIFSEGLSNSDYFLILLSKDSINSKWVKEELNNAIIRRMEGVTKLIPLLTESIEIPQPLKALKWLDMYSNYDKGLRSLINTIYNISEKPPVGKIPEHIVSLRNSVGGLSRQASTIGSLLIFKQEEEPGFERSYSASELHSLIEFMNNEEFNDAIDELEEYGLVKTLKVFGMHPYDFGQVNGTYALYLHFKNELKYDPENDIKSVAAVVSEKKEIDGNKLHSMLNIPPVRLNYAVAYLEDYGYVKVLKFLGTHPYDFGIVTATRHTRQFVDEHCK